MSYKRVCISLSEEQKVLLDVLGGSRFLQRMIDQQRSTICANTKTGVYRMLHELVLCDGVKDLTLSGWIPLCEFGHKDWLKYYERVTH